MKGKKIINMHASKAIILPKKFFKKGYLDENKPVFFSVLPHGKILITQNKYNNDLEKE